MNAQWRGVLGSKRHRDLSRARNQVTCRLHAVLCDLMPGGFRKEISAGQATRVLEQVTPAGAIAQARHELAGQFLEDLRNLDTQLRETRKKLAGAVKASHTTLTEVFGVGPVIADTIIGDAGDISRFPSRDHFAAYNGTAPVEVSSGNKKVHRLSLRGNRRVNHAIHMAAITQIRHRHSDGRAYYDRKIADGKTHKEALRSLKRRISNAIYARLRADARQAARPAKRAQEGNRGTTLDSSAAGSTRAPALRASHSRTQQAAVPGWLPVRGERVVHQDRRARLRRRPGRRHRRGDGRPGRRDDDVGQEGPAG